MKYAELQNRDTRTNYELAGAKKAPRREGRRGAAARLGWGANKRAEPTKHAWRGVVPFLRLFFKNFSRLENPLKALPNLALIALAVVGRRASATFRFFVMAGQVLTETDTFWPWRSKAYPCNHL